MPSTSPPRRPRTQLPVVLILLASLACTIPGLDRLLGATPEVGLLPTPTPQPPLAPRLVESLPALGEELSANGPITLFFDQDMDRGSVEAAFGIEPAASGDFSWTDDATLSFVPSGPLAAASQYRVHLGQQARSAAGLALETPIDLEWKTAGPLRVSQTLPADGAQQVDPRTVVTVAFNRPVVALALEQSGLNPLRFSPAVDGTGEWLDTSIYVFRPDRGLPGGVPVSVQVDPGLVDVTGSALDEPYVWSFVASFPRLESSEPAALATGVALDSAVVLSFNQAMDTRSVEGAFELAAASGGAIPGDFTWDERSRTVTFQPRTRLNYDAEYVVVVTAEARSAAGSPLESLASFNFHSVGLPEVLSSDPGPGARISPYSGVQFTFAGPMDEASLVGALSLRPEVEGRGLYWDEEVRSLSVYGQFEPRTEYVLTIDATAADPFGTPLATPYSLSFSTEDFPPALAFTRYSDALTLTQGRPAEVGLSLRNIERVDFSLFSLSLAEFLQQERSGSYSYDPRSAGTFWTDGSIKPDLDPNRTELVPLRLQDEPLPAGTYLLILDSPDDETEARGILLVVRSVELVMKTTLEETLIWAVDLASGEPLDGLPVRLLDENGTEIAAATTDLRGVARAELPSQTDPYSRTFAMAGGEAQEVFGLTSSSWAFGLEPYEFGVNLYVAAPRQTAYLYTDRPIYRPGHTVRVRGILRQVEPTGYALPAVSDVKLTLVDPTGVEVATATANLSDFGTFHAEFPLSPGGALGSYVIQSDYGSTYFDVSAYRKPEYTVRVAADREDVFPGDTVRLEIQAEYYFGGPVAGAEVFWTLWSGAYSLEGLPSSVSWDAAILTDEVSSPPVFENGSGRTGEDGVLIVEVDLPQDIDRSFTLSFDATLADSAGFPITGHGSLNLHASEVYLSLIPDRYSFDADQPAVVQLHALDYTGIPEAGVAAQVSVERVVWEQTVNTAGEVVWEPHGAPVNAGEAVTEADGIARFTFTPARAGNYRVRAEARDARRRRTTSETMLWISGPETAIWRGSPAGKMVLVPDRAEYAPGDTAHVLVPSPFAAPVNALVTVERLGILTHSVIPLGPGSTVEIPLGQEYAPNVFVSVVLVQPSRGDDPPALAMGLVELSVSAAAYELQVSVTPDRPSAGPGEEVTYQVRATDSAGRPVQAEFSLGLADLAALSLAPPNSQEPFPALYSPTWLSVATAASLSASGESLGSLPFADGRGGGGDGGDTSVRSEFPDTAYWNPTVLTDSRGEASITVRLPDSLTTWRMEARGVTRDTRVGSTHVDLVTTKPLLVRPVTPRTFTAGDHAAVAAVIHNNTARDLDVSAELVASGAQIEGATQTMVRVAAGGSEPVEWTIVVGNDPGVELTFRAQGGGFEDASRPTIGSAVDGVLPVARYSVPDTVATAGGLEGPGEQREAMSLPRRFDATQGELRVTVDLSLGAAMRVAVESLEQSTYESSEETVSRLLPRLAASQALEAMGVQDPALRDRLDRTLRDSLQTLLARQNPDGGWGWWSGQESDAYLTAYALYGLSLAGQAGASVPAARIESAVTLLRANLLPPSLAVNPEVRDRQAFLLFVLAEAGSGDLGLTHGVADHRSELSRWALALVATSLQRLSPQDGLLDAVYADLATAASTSATGTHWQDPRTDLWNLSSPVRTTAQAIQAITARNPGDPSLPGAIRWLLAARGRDGVWGSTHESAWAVLAISTWLEAQAELPADYDYTVRLNGRTVSEGTATPQGSLSTLEFADPVAELLAGEPNQLSFSRGPGSGALYYTAHLSVFRPVEDAEPLARGLNVERRYFAYDGRCGSLEDPCARADTARAGDDLLVQISLIVPADQYYVVVEDPFPAGMEPVDASLLTSPDFSPPADPGVEDVSRGWGWWWFTRTQVGDDRVTLFADYLPAGTYQYQYRLRAVFSGEYRVLPTCAWGGVLPRGDGQGQGRLFQISQTP